VQTQLLTILAGCFSVLGMPATAAAGTDPGGRVYAAFGPDFSADLTAAALPFAVLMGLVLAAHLTPPDGPAGRGDNR
jgi:hypothetical protein